VSTPQYIGNISNVTVTTWNLAGVMLFWTLIWCLSLCLFYVHQSWITSPKHMPPRAVITVST
jgi:hypothetical protein